MEKQGVPPPHLSANLEIREAIPTDLFQGIYAKEHRALDRSAHLQ
jgi:hypothetical protein